MFCQLAVGKMGYPGAEAVRFLGVTTSSVNRLLAIEEMPDLRKYLKMLWNLRPRRHSTTLRAKLVLQIGTVSGST